MSEELQNIDNSEATVKNAPDIQAIDAPELIDDKDFEVLVMPAKAGFKTTEQEMISRRPNLDKIDAVIEYLDRFAQIHPEIAGQVARYHEYLEANRKRIDEYKEAQTAEELLEGTDLPLQKLMRSPIASEKELKEETTEKMASTESDLVALSDSHESTYYEISAAERAATAQGKTAVVVFDDHIDLYEQPGLSKCNVFEHLYYEGAISATTFIGNSVGDSLISELERSGVPKGVFDNIRASELVTDGQTERTELISQLQKMISGYASRGIDRVVFSVDLDVLRKEKMGYTAMEYNPMEALAKIGGINIDFKKEPEDLTGAETFSIIHRLVEKKGSGESYSGEGLSLSDVGLSLEFIAEECKARGIKIGIDLKSGGRFIGDVVELTGPDYRGRTTKAASALLHRLADIARVYKN